LFISANLRGALVIIISILLLCGAVARCEANTPIPQTAVVETLDLTDLHKFLQTLDEETKKYLPRLDPQSWNLTGPKLDISGISKGITRYFLRELVFNLKLLGELLLLAMILAILQNFKHAFENDTVSQLAFGLCFLVVMGIVLNSFRVTFLIAKEALTEMSNFMYAIIPLLFSLITAGGGVTTTTLVHPLLLSSIGLMGGLVQNLIFPLIMFAGVLGMVNYLVEGFQVNKLADLFKTTSLGLLGLAMAIFIGLITIRGFAASVADSTALRTVKYFSNTFLPVVGGTVSDTMEMAAGCSQVLKSGLGIYGLIGVVLITVFPLVKILAVAAIFRLTSAVIQPLGNNRLADALHSVGGTFLNIFGAVTVVGLMFFIAISILVGVGNLRTG
jgi:stage III sporulation protein AE